MDVNERSSMTSRFFFLKKKKKISDYSKTVCTSEYRSNNIKTSLIII